MQFSHSKNSFLFKLTNHKIILSTYQSLLTIPLISIDDADILNFYNRKNKKQKSNLITTIVSS